MAIIMVVSFIVIVLIIVVLGYLSQSIAGVGKFIPIIGGAVFLVWLGVGIRQWMVFSRWKRKYQEFKALQKRLKRVLILKSDKGKSGPH
jgi:arginine exporter protein ArgO